MSEECKKAYEKALQDATDKQLIEFIFKWDGTTYLVKWHKAKWGYRIIASVEPKEKIWSKTARI